MPLKCLFSVYVCVCVCVDPSRNLQKSSTSTYFSRGKLVAGGGKGEIFGYTLFVFHELYIIYITFAKVIYL